jgi:spore germination protein YaaH
MNRHRALRPLAAGVAAAVLLTVAGCSSTSSPADHAAVIPASLSVEGYGVPGTATDRALARDRGALDVVGISGVNLSSGGAGVAASSQEALSTAAKAKADHLTSELLVTNIDQTKGVFCDDLASAMLSSAENRSFVIAGLSSEVAHGGYDGVQIDFESLSAADSADLVTFVSELRATLPASAAVSMTLPAVTSSSDYAAAGFDLARLAPLVARFVVMAYDQHGTGFSSSGPVGGLPWTRQAVAAATRLVKASKIDLGVAGYGYTWTTDGKGGVVTDAQARARAGDRARWVAEQGEWTATLANGTVIWWSDGRSLTVRANLAKSAGLHGVALWQLSSADPITRP